MTRVYLALGGNLGAVEQSFQRALDHLNALPTTGVVSFSSIYRSAAVGSNAGGEFCNAAASLETLLEPLVLLDHLQRIEDEFGRVRHTRWGPRPIDLDVILFGDRKIDHPRLRVPHPAAWYRRFVLDPLNEIAGGVVHPEKGLTIGELRQRLLVRPLPVAVAGGSAAERMQIIECLAADFPSVRSYDAVPCASVEPTSAAVPALTLWLGPGDVPAHRDFGSLPVSSRLDVSMAPDCNEYLRDVLRSALGE